MWIHLQESLLRLSKQTAKFFFSLFSQIIHNMYTTETCVVKHSHVMILSFWMNWLWQRYKVCCGSTLFSWVILREPYYLLKQWLIPVTPHLSCHSVWLLCPPWPGPCHAVSVWGFVHGHHHLLLVYLRQWAIPGQPLQGRVMPLENTHRQTHSQTGAWGSGLKLMLWRTQKVMSLIPGAFTFVRFRKASKKNVFHWKLLWINTSVKLLMSKY